MDLLDQFSAEKLEESFDNDGLILKSAVVMLSLENWQTGLRDACRGAGCQFSGVDIETDTRQVVCIIRTHQKGGCIKAPFHIILQ